MRHLTLASLFLLLTALAVYGQESFKKNSFQIGRSGYYFGDNTFKFGSNGGFTNHGWRVYVYTPYLAYSRRQFKYLGFSASVEEYRVAYCKNCIQPEAMKEESREFCTMQVGVQVYVPIHKRVEVILNINGVRRYNGLEVGTLLYIDHGTWLEGVGYTNKLNAWGLGTGLEAKLNVYKKFSISIKGEYMRFNQYIKEQIGLTACMGYDF